MYLNYISGLFDGDETLADKKVSSLKLKSGTIILVISILIGLVFIGFNLPGMIVGTLIGIILSVLNNTFINNTIDNYVLAKYDLIEPILTSSGIQNWDILNLRDIDGDGTFDEILFEHIHGTTYNPSELESAIPNISKLLGKIDGGHLLQVSNNQMLMIFHDHIINEIMNKGNIKNFYIVNMEEVIENPKKVRRIEFEHNPNTPYDLHQLKDSIEAIQKLLGRDGAKVKELEEGLIVIEFNDYVAKIMKAAGIDNWEIVNQEELETNPELNTIIWKHKSGKKHNIGELESGAKEIASILGKGRAVIKSLDMGKAEMHFKPYLVSKKDNIPFQKIEMPKNKLYLGVKNRKEQTFTLPEEESIGGFTQHMMIVGKSGSGKSFFTDNVLMGNWMNESNWDDIEKIYIIDYKNSGDYLKYKHLDKVEYSDGSVNSALAIMMKVLRHMLTRYMYQTQNGGGGYKGKKIILLSDEIQRVNAGLNENDRDKRMAWNKISELYQQFAEQARAANISMISILQKGTIDNLPGGSNFRDNNRHRLALLNDNMSLLLDQELIDKEGIRADRLEQGQFIYMDELQGESSLTEGFGVALDQPWTDYVINYKKLAYEGKDKDAEIIKTLNNIKFKEEDQKLIDNVKFYEKVIPIMEELEKEYFEEMKNSGKKLAIESMADLDNYTERDFALEAIEIYKKEVEEGIKFEDLMEEKREEYKEEILDYINEIENDPKFESKTYLPEELEHIELEELEDYEDDDWDKEEAEMEEINKRVQYNTAVVDELYARYFKEEVEEKQIEETKKIGNTMNFLENLE